RQLEDEFLAPLNEDERAHLHALLLRLAEKHEPRCAILSPDPSTPYTLILSACSTTRSGNDGWPRGWKLRMSTSSFSHPRPTSSTSRESNGRSRTSVRPRIRTAG